MARDPEPWRRGGPSGPWYAQVGGVQRYLAPATATKTEAKDNLKAVQAELAAHGKARKTGLRFRDVINAFIAHVDATVARGEREAVTAEGYKRFLIPMASGLGRHAALAIKPKHVEEWLDAQRYGPAKTPWGTTTRFNAITAVKACMNWAEQGGHLPANPLAKLKRPAASRRVDVLTPEQVRELIAHARDEPFRDLLSAFALTGCRPNEAYTLTAAGIDLDARTWTVVNKTRRKTGHPTRVLFLSDDALEMSRRLAGKHPDGPVFRNAKGGPWTRHTVAHRMARLATRLGYGAETVAYSFRHVFITDALASGVPPAMVAEQVGHSSLTMVMKVYNQLRGRQDQMRDAIRQIRPASEPAGDAHTPPHNPEQ